MDIPVLREPVSEAMAWAGKNGGYILICVLVGIAIGVVVGFALGRRRSHAVSFQNDGEARLSSEIRRHFNAPDYHLMNHITLRVQDGTTQVDHILVSRFGIFVIETKHYNGWIFANGKQKKWTQVFFKKKFQFQNPIHQNFVHVRAVQELLDFLPVNFFESAVVFTGDAEFRTEVPLGVFTLPDFIEHVRRKNAPVMSSNKLQLCVGRIETTRFAVSNETDVEHVENLQRRHRRPAILVDQSASENLRRPPYI